MLRYLGHGERQFDKFPVKPLVRMNWEFFAVVSGRCAPIFAPETSPPLISRTLWVFPPGSAHSWAGAKSGATRITVFHFGSVPSLLAAAVRERGYLSIPLEAVECRRLTTLARTIEPDFREPNNFSTLLFQGTLIELALLALRKLPHGRKPLPQGHAKQIVEAATAWFTDHVRSNPSIDEVARKVHVSTSTLRRVFRQTQSERPVRAFARIRLETAMRFMTESRSLKLETIAAETGFSSTSDFCRAFKAHTKVTPAVWRRTILAPPKAAIKDRSNG
jgi:AraC family transcriptional regulator